MTLENTPLTDNKDDNQFEVSIDGKIALINYIQKGHVYYLVHTEVPEDLQGQGIAGALVEKTFKLLEEGGFKIQPFCPYVQSYLERHPEWERLLAGNNL